MKFIYKLSMIAACFIAVANFSNANDLVVVSGGVLPQYSTITAAIAAASNGDRILVTPGIQYNEAVININKSVQILSNTEGQQFQVSANITVTPPVASSNIIIQGMDLLIGNIVGAAVPGAVRSKFTLVGSKIRNGYVDFYSNAYWELNMMQDSMIGTNPYIYLRFGKIIGNYINGGTGSTTNIYILSENAVAADTVYVVGNKLEMSNYGAGQVGLYCSNTTNFFYIANNYIKGNAYAQYLMYIYGSNSNQTGGNTLVNNTFYNTSQGYQTINFYSVSSFTFVYNNLVMNGGTGAYGFYMAGNQNNYVFSYNHFQLGNSNAMYGIVNDGTNVIGSNTTFDINTELPSPVQPLMAGIRMMDMPIMISPGMMPAAEAVRCALPTSTR